MVNKNINLIVATIGLIMFLIGAGLLTKSLDLISPALILMSIGVGMTFSVSIADVISDKTTKAKRRI